jgi:hypothetical protein
MNTEGPPNNYTIMLTVIIVVVVIVAKAVEAVLALGGEGVVQRLRGRRRGTVRVHAAAGALVRTPALRPLLAAALQKGHERLSAEDMSDVPQKKLEGIQ